MRKMEVKNQKMEVKNQKTEIKNQTSTSKPAHPAVLDMLKLVAEKTGEISGSLKQLCDVTYKLALILNRIIDSYESE